MREVEAFLAVAERLHFAHAAEQLRVTPSRISQTIRTLERRVGGPLFERTSRSVRLTPLGRQLEAQWRPAYLRLRHALSDAQAAANGPVTVRLRVGYPATIVPSLLETLSDYYAAERPDRRLLWLQDRMLDVYRYRSEAELGLDVLLGWFPPGQGTFNDHLLVGPPIRAVPPVLLLGPDHPLARRESVDIEELADYPLLRPGIVADLGIEWVPEHTPAGRLLRRVNVSDQHVEALLAVAVENGLAHLSVADMPSSPAWNLFRGRAIALPLTGHGPFTIRSVWPADSPTADLAVDFAALAHRAGKTAGWLDPPRAPSTASPHPKPTTSTS